MVIIDEASQALEAQCWVPSLSAQKLVLAGDHLQLPLTIKSSNMHPDPEISNSKLHESEPNQKLKLETTLFDRLLTFHGPSTKRMLTIQYRMHEKIMRFPSDEMYGSRLIAAEAVKARLLTSLPYLVLCQLRTGICRLNRYLGTIGATQRKCEKGVERVDHFLFRCPLWSDSRREIRQLAGPRWGDTSYLFRGWSGPQKDGPFEKWAPNTEKINATIRFALSTTRLNDNRDESSAQT